MPYSPDDNPYSAPRAAGAPVSIVRDDRLTALWRVRWAALILAVPAAANYVGLHFVHAPHRLPLGFIFSSGEMRLFFAAINFVGAVLTLLGTWYLGLMVFECAAVAAHHVAGGRLSKDQWLATMYHELWRLPWAAALGAALWLAWCYLYFLDDHFPVWAINVVLGGLGHLVAAWVYLPVLLAWYRLRRTSTASLPPGAAS